MRLPIKPRTERHNSTGFSECNSNVYCTVSELYQRNRQIITYDKGRMGVGGHVVVPTLFSEAILFFLTGRSVDYYRLYR